MTVSFLGDGLIFEDMLPLSFAPGPLIEGLALARMNADNAQLLGAEASLDDVRVHEALKDESPALVHELQRLEFKLNILLRLTAEIAVRSNSLPPAQRAQLSARGLEWYGAGAPATGVSGVLSIYVNPALPQPFKACVSVVGERTADGERVAQLQFVGLSEAALDLLEKLIFRRHRRLVAGARAALS